ncbi:MAG: DUF1638 domain-containing protein [Candidatus Bathyarchaeota archaeon]|nr:DUF1638 domain-containing protein [Candidatus Termiticorpusculum sp.]
MSKNEKICLVSCSVLKPELQRLVKEGKLDADLVFVSKNFHVDYSLIEKNVRKVLEYALKRYQGRVVLVYGDLCLGQDNEMKRLAKEYNVVKIDALNCIDCQLGGKGKSEAADPEHKLMFMGAGMIDFFKDMKLQLAKQGVDEDIFKKMFSDIEGFVILDTVDNSEECKRELEKLNMGVQVLETRKIGVENVRMVLLEAMEYLVSRG